MSRYIDADKLWNSRPQLSEGKSRDYGAGFSECMWGFSKEIKKQINNPTADVVEVVRCFECKWHKDVKHPELDVYSCFCARFRKTREVDARDFCSYGERRDKNEG